MAILKQRLNMKTADGYSTVHLETSSDLVQRDNGTSVEDALNTLTASVENLSTSVENVTNNITTEVKTIIQEGNAAHAETHATGGIDEIKPSDIGALSATGTAESAKKLETTRTFQVNLGSTSSVGFDGTGNVTPGVTGTLGVSNGGTGKTTAPLGLYNLINGCNTITGSDIVDTDVIPVGDVSAATAKSISVNELKNAFNTTVSFELIAEVPADGTSQEISVDFSGFDWSQWSVIVAEILREPDTSSSLYMMAYLRNISMLGGLNNGLGRRPTPGPILIALFPLRDGSQQITCLSFPHGDFTYSTSAYTDITTVSFLQNQSGVTSIMPQSAKVLVYGIH